MLPSIDLDKILLNSLLVSLWCPIILQSMCADIFSFTMDLIAVSLKLVSIDVWSLRIPMLTTLQSLTRQNNDRKQIKLSSICGYIVVLKDLQVV